MTAKNNRKKQKAEKGSRKDKRNKTKNITLDILSFILTIPTATIDGFAAKSLVLDELAYNKTLTSSVRNWIENLKQRGYLEEKEVKVNNVVQKSVKLTNKARIRLLDKISDGIDEDEKYRFVSFDIPEEKKVKRDKFRDLLKMLGFRKIQASLWVINKNVGSQVEMIAYELGIEKYITYIISEKTDIDGYLYKLFNK